MNELTLTVASADKGNGEPLGVNTCFCRTKQSPFAAVAAEGSFSVVLVRRRVTCNSETQLRSESPRLEHQLNSSPTTARPLVETS